MVLATGRASARRDLPAGQATGVEAGCVCGSSTWPNQTATSPPTTTGSPASLDDDHLHAACVARRRDEPEIGNQLELAVDRHVPHARRLDHSRNRLVVCCARRRDRDAGRRSAYRPEELVAAAVVGSRCP